MEIGQAWAPMVSLDEIQKDGILIDSFYKVKFEKSDIEKIHTLYYSKSKNVFVTVDNQTKELQVISDSDRIWSFREKYLGQMNVDSTTDFVEMDTIEYPIFKSEVDIQDIEMVKKYGRFLEKRYGSADIYYIESIDAFVIDSGQTVAGSLPRVPFQNNDLRKKYNIPFQDERFENLPF